MAADLWNDEREDALIDMWGQKPFLFDLSLKGYSNRLLRKSAMEEIAAKVGVSSKPFSPG